MTSRAILGLASVAGLVASMAMPAFAQTTTPNTTTPNTTTNGTTTTPATGTNRSMQNCANTTTGPAAATNTTGTTTTTNTTGTTNTSGTTTTTNTTGTTGTTPTGTTNGTIVTTPTCTTMPQTTMPASPSTGMPEMNALTSNPNGSDWLSKYNRPNVRSSNYLGATTRAHSMMRRCHYVMQNGMRMKVCR